jgi:hypothetical protein
MLTDKYLTFMKSTDTAAAATRALPLGQNDLAAPTDGMGPYDGFWLVLCSPSDVTGDSDLTVTLQSSDSQTGTYATAATYTVPTGTKAGIVLKTPVPFTVKNWVKLGFSAASAFDAFMTLGVPKGIDVND